MRSWRLTLMAMALAARWAGLSAAVVDVDVNFRSNGRPVEPDAMSVTNAAGQHLSISRLDLLLSDFAFRTTTGDWKRPAETIAFVSLGRKRSRFDLRDLPPGDFNRVRFHVGLAPKTNHSDPAQYGPDHPLNPVLNGLHWSWRDGYVFLALEGKWRDAASGDVSGYSYHLGGDAMLARVELPLDARVRGDARMELELWLDELFAGENPLRIAVGTRSTHARDGDALAARIRDRLPPAFKVAGFGEPSAPPEPRRVGASKREVLIAKTATPYRFTFGRHFPPPRLPVDNPLTEEGVALGRILFHDPALSINGTQSCASCHQADAGFVDKGRTFSLGAEGREGTRNTMPLFNLAWKERFFWDGRAPSLRAQVLMPIQDPVEMHETLPSVVVKLRRSSSYPEMFERAFASRTISADRVARALEQFLLTLVSHDARFDRAMRNQARLTAEERRGFLLFMTEHDPRRNLYGADCFHCHGGPLFGSNAFFNNGLDEEFVDVGLERVTGRIHDRGRFSTPSLRNVELTAPYMHDGRFKTLEQVIDHYSEGVKRSASLDPNLAKHPAGGVRLEPADRRALVAFLKTLTEERFRSAAGGGRK